MLTLKERRSLAHKRGMLIAYGGMVEIPEEYRRFLGVLTDDALYAAVRNSERITPEDIDRIVDASNGSMPVMSYITRLVAKKGMNGVLSHSTNYYSCKCGVGKHRIEALVALGVEDKRGSRESYERVISGNFDGTIDGVPVSGKICGTYVSDRSRDNRI